MEVISSEVENSWSKYKRETIYLHKKIVILFNFIGNYPKKLLLDLGLKTGGRNTN